MSQAIGQVISFGVAVALSPIAIVAVVLMLGTPRAGSNATAFLAGWIGGLAIAGTIVLLVSGGAGASEGGEPADWVNVLKLAIGLFLLRFAVRRWRKRPKEGDEPELPRWMKSIDRFDARRAAAIGAVLSAANPKNLVLAIGAASAIAQTGVGAGEQAVALAVFIAVGTLGIGIPTLLYLSMRDRSRQTLEELKDWMTRNDATVIAVVCLLIGAKLIGDAIAGF